jgi:putative restriction endonuclease
MQGWVGVTDSDWYGALVQRPFWPEVNFWTPSDFHAFYGEVGRPFFFKLKSPANAIAGFGFFAKYTRLPEWLAWEWFGPANGAATFDEMQARVNLYRRRNDLQGRAGGPPQIGCIVLTQAAFFPRDMWIPQPEDWPRQNLRHKRYDLRVGEGLRVWQACLERVVTLRAGVGALVADRLAVDLVDEARYGTPTLVAPRLGQGAFRAIVTDAYRRCCAITEEHSLPALEAAHIRPFAREGPHDVRNGLLLRSDVHRLFDLGYVTVTPDHHFEVSDRLKGDYSNGRSYYPLRGKVLTIPPAVADRPDAAFLRWHNDTVFRG